MARVSLKKTKLGPKDCGSGEPHVKQKKILLPTYLRAQPALPDPGQVGVRVRGAGPGLNLGQVRVEVEPAQVVVL